MRYRTPASDSHWPHRLACRCASAVQHCVRRRTDPTSSGTQAAVSRPDRIARFFRLSRGLDHRQEYSRCFTTTFQPARCNLRSAWSVMAPRTRSRATPAHTPDALMANQRSTGRPACGTLRARCRTGVVSLSGRMLWAPPGWIGARLFTRPGLSTAVGRASSRHQPLRRRRLRR